MSIPITVKSGDFMAFGSTPLTANDYTNYYGDMFGYLIDSLEDNPALIPSCKVHYAANNVTERYDPGISSCGEFEHPNTKYVRYGSYNNDISVTFGYGDHLKPSLVGTVNIRHKCPDIYINDDGLNKYDWNHVVPVIEGYVCQPSVVGNRLYALDGSQHGVCGVNGQVQVGVLDFSDIGVVTTVPFSDCTRTGAYGFTIPTQYSLKNATVMMCVKGRLIPQHRCTIIGNIVIPDIKALEVACWSGYDKALHGITTPHQSVYYLTQTDINYLNSDNYVKEGFMIIVATDKPIVCSVYDNMVRINRNRMLFQGKVDGLLVNEATGLIQPAMVERYTSTQTHFMKSGKRYNPQVSSGINTTAIHLNPTTTGEDTLLDIDYTRHVVWRIKTLEK